LPGAGESPAAGSAAGRSLPATGKSMLMICGSLARIGWQGVFIDYLLLTIDYLG